MKKEMSTYNGKAWLRRELRPYRAAIVLLAFFNVLATVLSLSFAYLVRYVINSATNGKASMLWTFSAVLLGVLLLKILLKTIDAFYAEKLRAKIVAELRMKVFSKVLRSEYSYVIQHHSGDILNRLTTDIQEVASISVGFLAAITSMVVQCVGAVGALVTIDPLFTFIYVVCGAVFGGLTALFRRQLKKRQKEVVQADGEHRSFMQEGVSSVMTLKAYGAESRTVEKSGVYARNYYKKRMNRNILRSCMSGIFSLLSNSGLIFAVVWCAVSVLRGNDDFGSILSVILLLMQFQQPLSGFSSLMPAYYARLASGERLAEIDEMPCEEISDTQECSVSYESLQKISFEDIEFSYGREPVLTRAEACVEKGEIVCLTGASGAGKSTLFKLLLNVYTPTDGAVYLETSSGKVPLTAKERGLFAYVPQGRFLFSGTIYENLTFFASEKSEEELNVSIQEALRVACAEFVWSLPEGLKTPLCEGGGGLSEGQMQRLAVARAILSERPILLLDEATSALDSQTEKDLLENIRALQGRTCLIVTHRPAALAIADKVLSVENGKITQTK